MNIHVLRNASLPWKYYKWQTDILNFDSNNISNVTGAFSFTDRQYVHAEISIVINSKWCKFASSENWHRQQQWCQRQHTSNYTWLYIHVTRFAEKKNKWKNKKELKSATCTQGIMSKLPVFNQFWSSHYQKTHICIFYFWYQAMTALSYTQSMQRNKEWEFSKADFEHWETKFNFNINSFQLFLCCKEKYMYLYKVEKWEKKREKKRHSWLPSLVM